MQWHWRSAADSPVESAELKQPAAGFPDQGEAERWLGEVWPELLAAGVREVSLFEEGRRVYGPMSLAP